MFLCLGAYITNSKVKILFINGTLWFISSWDLYEIFVVL